MKFLLPSLCLALGVLDAAFGAPPIFEENLELCGLPDVQRIRGLSDRAIEETIREETLPDGRKLEIAVRLPFREGKAAETVTGVVFVAPYVNERFRTVRSPLAKALVQRLGCAVVSICAEKKRPGEDPFLSSYVYPQSGYHHAVEREILRIKAERGSEETPVFTLGYSIGGVMALYLARSPALSVRGVVALEFAQDTHIAPDVFKLSCPALIINPEDSPWNPIAARRHGEAVADGVPAAFVVTRPVVDMDEGARYYRKAGGRYSNELAYCFIRDAISSSSAGSWPADWRPRPAQISTPAGDWEESVLSSSDDFLSLHRLATHNYAEVLDGGESAYLAAHPNLRRHALVVLKKGTWLYPDQARLAAMSVERGGRVAICAVPEDAAVPAFVSRQLERLSAPDTTVTVLALRDDHGSGWTRAVETACADARLIWLDRGDAYRAPDPTLPRSVAHLRARAGHEPGREIGSLLDTQETWILPDDFKALLDLLARDAASAPSPSLGP